MSKDILISAATFATLVSASSFGQSAPDSADAPADAQAPSWIVWDRSLQMTRGRLTVLDSQGIHLVDQSGRDVALARDDVAALLRLPDQTAPADQREIGWPLGDARHAVIQLADGQRWYGQLQNSNPDGEIALTLPGVGPVSISLDVIRSMRFSAAEVAPPADQQSDVIILDNGDQLDGTVLSVGPSVELDRGGQAIEVDRANVAWIGLVNPELSPPPMRVWLWTGWVFGATEISGGVAEGLTLSAVAPTWKDGVWKPIGTVSAWSGTSGSLIAGVEVLPRRLVPLASLEIDSYQPSEPRRWTQPPRVEDSGARLGLEPIHLPGPMSVTWNLPRAADRASGELSLANSDAAWSDCIVRVEQAERVLWEQRLNHDQPRAAFAVQLGDEPTVTIRVLPGAYGPVEDAVDVALGWILLTEPE